MNSFNHYAYGSSGAWRYSLVAGIELDPARPGYKHIILRPQPGGGLTQVTGKLETLYGELVSKWTLADDTFDWMVVIPPNTTATVHLPVKEVSDITLKGQAVSGSVHEVERASITLW